MVRAPCCEKMGLKRGPWTPEEDKILVSHIEKKGHENWRALPRQAGLLRCGKSCRLRWTNYLRPDIKRGNFSREEEETIIQLHEMLGNRWSAIAAKLPGRTDNEIKNVWHTHLKKRLKQNQANTEIILQSTTSDSKSPRQSESSDLDILPSLHQACAPMSPQPSSSEFSSLTDASVTVNNISHIKIDDMDLSESFPEFGESIWSEPPLVKTTSWSEPPLVETTSNNMPSNLLTVSADDQSQAQSQFNPVEIVDLGCNYDSIIDDDMDFWYNLFIRAGGSAELSEF
ncbi:hypothetical protein FH972_025371 [Carpinus fangiana]|uniref:Uncharacterized protein n=1 Tax=Carpinus fangiana TaxID=176857 RepID=A0A5N6L180_9ROSI|nr:hypothetical protein FH972_025371 [Carpinus fangiana]